MKVLSIKQPWVYAITDLGKRVENRTWKPPVNLIGQRIALHASKTADRAGVDALHNILGESVPIPATAPRGAIVATATLMGWYSRHEFSCMVNDIDINAWRGDKWYAGEIGWMLDEVRTFTPGPAHCKGRLGVWEIAPIVVTAGRYDEARHWMESHRLTENRHAFYVPHEQRLRGLAIGFPYVRVGNWNEHGRAPAINRLLDMRGGPEFKPVDIA